MNPTSTLRHGFIGLLIGCFVFVSPALSAPPPVQMNGLEINVAALSQNTPLYVHGSGPQTALVQFNHVTSVKERNIWRKRGVEFLQYVPNHAYLIKAMPKLLQQLNANAKTVGVINIPTQAKLDQSVRLALNGSPGSVAVQEQSARTTLKPVKIIFFPNTPFQLAKALFEAHGVTITSTHRDYDYRQTLNKISVPQNVIEPLARSRWVYLIAEPDPPFRPTNANSQATSLVNALHPDGESGHNLDGSGVTVGIWDAGSVRLTHEQIIGRATQIDGPNNINLHASHVAGTMVASGNGNPTAQGMAPNANILCFTWQSDLSEVEQYQDQVVVSNHSYATAAGLEFDETSGEWHFYGNPVFHPFVSNYLSGYTTRSRAWDQIAYDFNHITVTSAGNNRQSITAKFPPSYLINGDPGRRYKPNLDAQFTTQGFGNITPFGSAKNVITVGALRDIPEFPPIPTDETMTAFSSWGPTDDGRLKPDIVANGSQLISLSNEGDDKYSTFSGTSMSSPTVAGTVGLLTQQLKQLYQIEPTPELMKSILVHTAIDGGSLRGPDYRFGYGLMNAQAAADFIAQSRNGKTLLKFDAISDATVEYQTTYTGQGPIRATLAWTDPPGNPVLGGLNEDTPLLVNDLDVRIVGPDGQHYPWTLDPHNPDTPAQQDRPNHRDTVEQVLIENPLPGTYTVQISGQVNFGLQQQFALCLSGLQEDRGVPRLTRFQPVANNSIQGKPVFAYFISGNTPMTQFRLLIDGEPFDNPQTLEIEGSITYTEPRSRFAQTIPIDTTRIPNGLHTITAQAVAESGETIQHQAEFLILNPKKNNALIADGPLVVAQISHRTPKNPFIFEVPEDGYYTIESHSLDDLPSGELLDLFMELSGPFTSNQQIALDDDGGVQLHAKITAFLEANKPYFLIAQALFNSTGFYGLTLKRSQQEAFGNPAPIAINEAMLQAEITDIGDTAWFSFKTPPLREMNMGGRLRFQTPQSEQNPLRNVRYKLFRRGRQSKPIAQWTRYDGIWEILEGEQEYFIAVSGNKSKGRFQLRVVDPEVTPITVNGEPVVESIENKNEEDWFSFITPSEIQLPIQNRFLIASATPHAFEGEGYKMRLFHERDLNQIINNGDDQTPMWTVLDADQRYFIKVTPAPATSTITYNLQVNQPQLEGNTPTVLQINGPQNTLEFVTARLEEKWFEFTTQKRAYHFITIDFHSQEALDTFTFTLFDEPFLPRPVSQIDFKDKSRAQILIFLQPNRRHFIAVSSQGHHGSVSVAVRDTDPALPATIDRRFSARGYIPGEPIEVQLKPIVLEASGVNTIHINEKPPEGWTLVEEDIRRLRENGRLSLTLTPGQILRYTLIPPLDAEGCQTFTLQGRAAGGGKQKAFGPIEARLCPLEDPPAPAGTRFPPVAKAEGALQVISTPFMENHPSTSINHWRLH